MYEARAARVGIGRGGDRLGVHADLLERVADRELAADHADRSDDARRLGDDLGAVHAR